MSVSVTTHRGGSLAFQLRYVQAPTLHALSIQGVKGLLDSVAAFALQVDELGD